MRHENNMKTLLSSADIGNTERLIITSRLRDRSRDYGGMKDLYLF
jgi:hypothetical protein